MTFKPADTRDYPAYLHHPGSLYCEDPVEVEQPEPVKPLPTAAFFATLGIIYVVAHSLLWLVCC